MPFQSAKQKRFLWANEPEVAREFADKEKHKRGAGKKALDGVKRAGKRKKKDE